MSKLTKASRPKPRVALIGVFIEGLSYKIKELFPTVWMAKDYDELTERISHKEIDLIVLNAVTLPPEWCDQVHMITFSNYMAYIPGPTNGWITMEEVSNTEEYYLPKLSLAVSNVLQHDLVKLNSAKNLRLLKFNAHQHTTAAEDQIERDSFHNGALFIDPHTNQPYAAIYARNNPPKGVAILPNKIFDKLSWIKLISSLWVEIDSDTFADFSDWHSDLTWSTKEETEIKKEIESLILKKEEMILQTDIKIEELNRLLTDKSVEVNKGVRKLLTAQGNELVFEVGKTFEKLGFSVQYLDAERANDKLKREDLRLTDNDDEKWEAIVEVRGYSKSAGQTSDLLRLNRFAELYFSEKGNIPDKRIYVVNGQIELMPSQRQVPLISAKEDIDIFKEQNGLVISTIELFKLIKEQPDTYSFVKERIKEEIGIFFLKS